MRTIDPEIWSEKLKKPRIRVSRRNKFGQQPSKKYERIFRESIVDATLEFWANCSAPAVKFINMDNISKEERRCYIFLLVVTMGLGIFVVSHTRYMFSVTSPLVISGQSSAVFMADISFPAVAICSNCIISRNAVKNFTEYIYNHPRNHLGPKPEYNRSQIENYLVDLGALLMFSLPRLQLEFGLFMKDIYPYLNITDVMFKLTPSCQSMMRRCSWRGRLVPCESLFAARATPLGFCCVFNSRYYPDDANNKPQVLDLIGQNHGLGVVITENRDDFMYMRRNVYGAEMLIFEGSEYPLLESGDVRMYPVPRNVSIYVNIKALIQKASDDVNYYSEERRGCRAQGPGQAWCLTNCRRETTATLCGCVPYTLQAGHYNDTRRTCVLRDLACLNKHREKFMYLFPSTPGSKEDSHLNEERQDSMICEQCRVLCRRQLFTARISYSSNMGKDKLFGNFLTHDLDVVNTSSVRLFYNSEHHDLYSVETYLRWYELVVKLSTLWTVVAGVSALVVVELVYHIIFRWPYHYCRRLKLASLQPPAPST